MRSVCFMAWLLFWRHLLTMAPTKKEYTSLTLKQKAKIIEESRKPGFVRRICMEKYCLQISSLERQTQPQITDVFKPKWSNISLYLTVIFNILKFGKFANWDNWINGKLLCDGKFPFIQVRLYDALAFCFYALGGRPGRPGLGFCIQYSHFMAFFTKHFEPYLAFTNQILIWHWRPNKATITRIFI